MVDLNYYLLAWRLQSSHQFTQNLTMKGLLIGTLVFYFTSVARAQGKPYRYFDQFNHTIFDHIFHQTPSAMWMHQLNWMWSSRMETLSCTRPQPKGGTVTTWTVSSPMSWTSPVLRWSFTAIRSTSRMVTGRTAAAATSWRLVTTMEWKRKILELFILSVLFHLQLLLYSVFVGKRKTLFSNLPPTWSYSSPVTATRGASEPRDVSSGVV